MNIMNIRYLPNGRRVEYLGDFNGKHVVRGRDDGDDGTEYLTSDKLYTTLDEILTPIERQIDDAKQRLQDIERRISTATREAEALERAQTALIRELSGSNKALEHLGDFLAGRITHYVVEQSSAYPKLRTRAELKCDDDSRSDKLLVLHGLSNGDLQWRINQYRDGSSGGWMDVIPASSRDSAVAIWRDCMSAWLNTFQPSSYDSPAYFVGMQEETRRNAPDMLDTVNEWWSTHQKVLLEQKAKKLQADLDEVENEKQRLP